MPNSKTSKKQLTANRRNAKISTGPTIWAKNIKSEKGSHFAVTKGGETTYREFLRPKKRLGTKFSSNFVEIVRD